MQSVVTYDSIHNHSPFMLLISLTFSVTFPVFGIDPQALDSSSLPLLFPETFTLDNCFTLKLHNWWITVSVISSLILDPENLSGEVLYLHYWNVTPTCQQVVHFFQQLMMLIVLRVFSMLNPHGRQHVAVGDWQIQWLQV